MKIGVILLFLILSGCCFKSEHKNLKCSQLDIPENFLVQKELPKFDGTLTKDLTFYIADLKLFSSECQADKNSIKNILDKTK